MKKLTTLNKLVLLLVLVFGLDLYQSQLTQFENYVYSKTHLSAPTDTNQKTSETVTYFDGLGRPKQSIAIKSTPGGKDLVTPIVYDGFGRQTLDYLPVPVSSLNGSIQPTTGNNVNSYYSGIGLGNIAYSEKKLENSPLDRLFEQIQPGADWQNHPVTFDYLSNTATDVLKFSTVTLTGSGIFYTSQLKVDGRYPASQLYKNQVSDEDGNTTYEFKNSQGQTLLVRKLLSNSDIVQSLAPQPTASYVDTYYVYNEYNQLAFVIPPLAVSEFNANPNQTISNPKTVPNAIIDNLCYQYDYDGRNRLAEKKLPGKGWEYMVYDQQDRLVLTQDSNLRTVNNNFSGKGWIFTKYDQFGRVVYTGFFSNTATRQAMQTALNSMAQNASNNETRSTTAFSQNGMEVYYTKNAFPTGSMKILSVNYYDTYPSGTPFPTYNKVLGQDILLEAYDSLGRSVKSLSLASYVKNINDDSWTKNYSFYDTKGRPVGSTSINHLGGRTVISSKLDFAGVVQQTRTQHKRLNVEMPINIIEDFVYDHQNRLLKHYHEVVGKTPKELLADNTYDELGRLTTKKVGSISNANLDIVSQPLQSIEYDYNIRGWMTGINLNPTTGNLDTGKLFSYKIKYNNPANNGLKKYNGNIAEIDWAYGTANPKRYEYTYDSLNRLKKGAYKSLGLSETFDSKHYNEELTYDVNGNIKTLKRNARPQTGQTATQVDNLKYYYENNNLSNRLWKITDNEGFVANPSGYPGGGGTNTYDANGNMLTMPDKGITQNIVYNYLNLPQVVTKNAQPVNYSYRADGAKIYKSFSFNSQQIETDYLDGFVYTTAYSNEIEMALRETPASEEMSVAGQGDAFELAEKEFIIKDPNGGPIAITESAPNFFPTAEGFYDYDNFRYIYQYKDHLGNARLNYGRDSEGVLFTEDGNDYYPFGLNFINPVGTGGPAQVYNPSATYKNYKYNGKELQETGMYDYGARFYMPDVVIWGQYDPLAEITFQPYAYAYNNPIFYNDPTGMIGEGTGSGGDPEFYKNGKVTEIQEVVVTAKLKSVSGGSAGISMPSNCVACFASGNFSFPEPKPKIDPKANCGWCHDGPVKYIGGAGDPLGIWETLGMWLSSEDSGMKYAAVPLLILKGQEDKALKVLAAEKGMFVVDEAGVAVSTSQSRMTQGFDAAGFSKTAATQTTESGAIYNVPTANGNVNVRAMQGNSKNGMRSVFSDPKNGDYRKIGGGQFKGPVSKIDRIVGSHLKQTK